MANKGSIEDLFNDDPFGLLNVKSSNPGLRNEDDRLISSFEEINDFYEKNKREPSSANGIQEHQLLARLKGIRSDIQKIEILSPFDKFKLLQATNKEIKTISDVFENDKFGLLNTDENSIFNLKHVPKETTMPDYVASRKACVDFELFEPLFLRCHHDLQSKARKLTPFKNEQQIDKGYFFVLKGILLYVADISEREKLAGKFNARLRCIFENGTESDMLLRSLAAELYKNGRRITEHNEKLLDNFSDVSIEDKESGHIYVLKSKSHRPEIATLPNLYKIGYSKGPVEERIKNAEQDPTFLMAPVQIVTAYKCYNMNPQKLELLLHTFFGTSCLNVDVFDVKGRRTSPREWFIAPLTIIESVIEMLVSGEIINYKYDVDTQRIVAL